MPPQTRSMTQPNGRTTRNSLYGRPFVPPPPSKLRKTFKSQSESAQACDSPAGDDTVVDQTGKGMLENPSNDRADDVDEEEDAAEVEMMVDEAPDVMTPPPGANRPLDIHDSDPETPVALNGYEAGSVVLTPVKKRKPLQQSPAFMDVENTALHDDVFQTGHGYLGPSMNALLADRMRTRRDACVAVRPTYQLRSAAYPLRLGPCGTEIYD